MSLNTPLRSLERHGEIFRGDPLDAPSYGSPAEGMWVPVVNWEAVGMPSPDPGEMWSVIGNIPSDGGDFLAFLLRFRKIVEPEGSIPRKLERIDALCDSCKEYRRIAQRISESSDSGQRIGGRDFAEKFFAKSFQNIPGVGPDTALRIFDAGFHTLRDLAAASDADLRQVRGVGPALVEKIRTHTREIGTEGSSV